MGLATAELPHGDHRPFERQAELSGLRRGVVDRVLRTGLVAAAVWAHATASAAAPGSSATRSGSSGPAAACAWRAFCAARIKTTHGTLATRASATDHQNAVPYAWAAA